MKMKKHVEPQLKHPPSSFGREPREVLADAGKVAPWFPTTLLLVCHSLGNRLVDMDSKTRLHDLTSLMLQGAVPVGFVGMDENLDLAGVVPLEEFRDAEWAVRILHQAYCERTFGTCETASRVISPSTMRQILSGFSSFNSCGNASFGNP
jgi:hypothetical protein